MRLRAALRRALLVLLTALLAIPTGVIAAPTAAAVRAGDTSSGSTPLVVAYAYDVPAPLSPSDTGATGAAGSSSGPRVVSAVRSASVRDRGVAANTADDVGGMIYRTGSRTDNALTDASGVSFRDSVSSSLSSQHPQIFRPGDKVWAVDTSRLPPGAVVRDGVPPGHVSVNATPGQIRDAIVDDPFLGGLGLKPLDELGSYRLPRRGNRDE